MLIERVGEVSLVVRRLRGIIRGPVVSQSVESVRRYRRGIIQYRQITRHAAAHRCGIASGRAVLHALRSFSFGRVPNGGS